MSYTKKSWLYLLMFLLALAGATSALAQGIDGSLRGELKDPQGALVVGAKVTIQNERTGETRETKTNETGTFFVPNLLIGTYSVTIEVSGFKKFVRRGVDIKANQVSEVGITLEIGAVAEVVEVTAGAELVQTSTSQLSSSFEERLVRDLPGNPIGGGIYDLALLLPNVGSQPGGVTGFGGTVGGNRPRNNNFVLDGVDNNDISVTGPVQEVIPDTVGEFTVLTNQFSAEYGHSTAAQYIVNTKTGTNELHGKAWYYLRNRKLDASDNIFLDSLDPSCFTGSPAPGVNCKDPRFDNNRMGGDLGGKILRDKLFAYGAFQYETEGQAAIPGSAISIPTTAGFSALRSLAQRDNTVSTLMLDILENNTQGFSVSPSGSVDVFDTPADTFIPIEIGSILPVAPVLFTNYNWVASVDGIWKNHRSSGRYLQGRFRSLAVGEAPFPQFSSSQVFDNQRVTFTDAWTIKPNLVNEFRAGWARNIGGFPVPDLTPPGGLDVFPNFVIDDLSLNLGPNGNFPQSGGQDTYQLVEQLNWVKGKHTLKFGFDIRNNIAPSDFLPRARGEYDYANLDEYIRDRLPTGTNQAKRGVGSGFFASNFWSFYGYFQDDIKIHPRVTLNLGLRYEWYDIPRDSALQAINSIATVPGVIEFRVPKTDNNNWAPRFGFAWDIFGDKKTSLRGGAAVGYDFLFTNLALLQLPGQLQQETNSQAACQLPSPPAWCPDPSVSGLGFIATGGLPPTPIPTQLGPAEARSATGALIVDTVAPKTFTWTLGIQREIRRDLAVEVRYVGTRGLSLVTQVQRNAGVPITSPTVPNGTWFGIPTDPNLIQGSLPTFVSSSAVPANMAGATTLAELCDAVILDFGFCGRPQVLSPFGFDGGVITAFDPIGQSIYHGGSVRVTKRMSHGLTLDGTYTYSKTIDTITNELFTSRVNPRRPQDFLNAVGGNRGLSALDHTHHFAVSWVYELPKYKGGSGILGKVLSGFQVTGTYVAETGQPVTIQSGVDANGNIDSAGDRAFFNPNGTAGVGSAVRAVCIDASGNTSLGASRFPSACGGAQFLVGYWGVTPNAQYIQTGMGALSNLGPNTVRSAGLNNWNLGFYKDTYIRGERMKVQVRADFINAFNHPQSVIGGLGASVNSLAGSDAPASTGSGFALPASSSFLNQRIFSTGNRIIVLAVKFFF